MQAKGSSWSARTVAQVKTDLGLTGTNSGDQTSIVGITGTTAQFNAALTDNDFATLAGTELLLNKTVEDSNFTIRDNTDTTKLARFQVSDLTTGTTRTYTLPDRSDTLVTLGGTQTLTTKTLTTPTIGDFTNATHNHTNSASGGQLSLTAAVTGILPIANGGTGSATQNFIDLSSTQTVAGLKTFASNVAGLKFAPSNVPSTSGNGVHYDSSALYDVTVPTGQTLALMSMNIRNRATTTADSQFYGILIKTESDAIDTGAGISIENNGKADAIYLGIKGKSGSPSNNAPSGIGLDLNHGTGATEDSSTFAGTGMHIWDWSTTNNGDNGPTLIKLNKELDPNNNHKMLYFRANQRHIELYTPEGVGYDGTKSVLKLFNNTSTKFNLTANGRVGIGLDAPLVDLHITNTGEAEIRLENSATADTRAKMSITGNATNGRGHMVISGKHRGLFTAVRNRAHPMTNQAIQSLD